MDEPLSKSQWKLRGRKICDMSIGQLRDWIDACDKMENWVGFNKSRRSWKQSREEAIAELQRRETHAPAGSRFPKMRLDLRHTTLQDFDFSYAVTEDAMREYVEQTWGHWDPEYQQSAHRQSFNVDTHYVVLLDGAPIGIMAVVRQSDRIQVEKIYLLSGYRGQGVGTELLRRFLEEARAKQLPVRLRVLAVNTRAQAFYARHGFEVESSTPERVFMVAKPHD